MYKWSSVFEQEANNKVLSQLVLCSLSSEKVAC